MNIFEKLPKYIATLVAFGTFIGIVHNYSYYEYFHINYFAFSDFSEILGEFIPSVILLVLLLIVPIALNFALWIAKKDEEEPLKAPKIKIPPKWVLPINITCFLLTVIMFLDSIMRVHLIWIYLLASLLCWGFVKLFLSVIRILPKTQSFWKVFIVDIVLTSCLCILIVPTMEIKFYVFGKKPAILNVVFKDSTIVKTDSVNFYIGQTKNYFFMYNKPSDITTVYKTEDINRYYIKSSLNKIY